MWISKLKVEKNEVRFYIAQEYSDWATGWTTKVQFYAGARDFLFSIGPRSILGPIQTPTQNLAVDYFPGGKAGGT
jgi:hypothetical protein